MKGWGMAIDIVKIKRRIFISTVSAIILTGLFPPWHSVYSSGRKNYGYYFIGNPPSGGTLTISTLVLQIIIIAFTGVAITYYFKTYATNNNYLDKIKHFLLKFKKLIIIISVLLFICFLYLIFFGIKKKEVMPPPPSIYPMQFDR
jgi:hypothetical protein